MSTFHEKQKQLREQMATHAIFEAAVEVASTKGYDNLTMHDIAEKAGIAIGTIYNYFKNKEDLFFYVHEQMHIAIQEQLDSISQKENDPDQRIREFFKEVFQFCDKYKIVFSIGKQPGIKERSPQEQKNGRIAKHIRATQKIIEDGIKLKKFRNVDACQTANMFLLAMVGVMELQIHLGDDYFNREIKFIEQFFLDYLSIKED